MTIEQLTFDEMQAKANEIISLLNELSLPEANTILTMAQGQLTQYCYVKRLKEQS